MKITKTKIKDLVLLRTNIYRDNRGFFKEVQKNKIFKKKFIFDCFSFSKKNTLRGLHLQIKKSQAKLITVVQGKILDVVVDLRKNSKTFGKYFSAKLSEGNRTMMYVPKGFAHGFITLKPNSEVFYLISNSYEPKAENTLIWNDPKISIKWPISPSIISKKDKNGKLLKDLKKLVI